MSENHTETESVRGQRLTVALDNLYLDPNNYRFVDHRDYKQISDDRVSEAEVQRRTTRFLLGKSEEYVRDLIASIKENGWLEVDPILVRKLSRGAYLVVEGNRRIAALKHLKRRYEEDAIDLGKLDSVIFSKVPVITYGDANERQHLVLMGLHHITGKRRWPAVNRALAIKRLTDNWGGDADAVCRALGISKREYNLTIRTLALVDIYKASDYGDQFQAEQFNLFREILNRPAIRDWLHWDHTTLTAKNQRNLERVFSWISREPEPDDDAEGEGDTRSTGEPVITTGGHVRELAKIIGDDIAIKRLDETRSLQEATLSSDLLLKNEIDGVLESCDREINRLNGRVGQLGQNELDKVEEFIGKLQGIALARKRRPHIDRNSQSWQPFNELTQTQFSAVSINAYRGLSNIELSGLGRVNLLVGVNNSGKTSLLEAVYLLAHQNDDRALLDLTRWRGRIEGDPDPNWLVEQLPRNARIIGSFDAIDSNVASVEFTTNRDPDETIADQTAFLAQLSIESQYAGRGQSTAVVFFADRPRQTNFQGRQWLCRSVFTSPFSANRPETLARCNKDSLRSGTKERIVDFIRNRLDSGIRNIEHVDKFNRFLVPHSEFARAPDLGVFGDGVRRVFEIGLLLAGARGGVVLIDEFENALHNELLHDFTRFLQELAVDLNVQIFLSTHSKETIDAFVMNDYRTDDIAGFALTRNAGATSVRRFSGPQLRELHEAVDFDLRGVR